MPNGLHSHSFRGRTTFNDGHTHGYTGITSLSPDVRGHVHFITGATTFNDGHIHRYALYTSREIPVAGGHTHFYQAATSFNDRHVHFLFGFTSVFRQARGHTEGWDSEE
jgi:hypothetical protein